MVEKKVVQIQGHAKPTSALRTMLGKSAAPIDPRMKALVEREDAIHGLAALLTQAMETCQTSDGRVDMKDVAAHVLTVMGRNQRS